MIRFTLLLLLLNLSLFSLSTLPYTQLSQKLFNAQTQLTALQNIQEFSAVASRFSKETQESKSLGKEIMQDGNVNADEAKKYLQKLRELDATYEGVLAVTRAKLKSAIEQNNYPMFQKIVNSDLPKLFHKSSLQCDALAFYKKKRKKEKNLIMERELHNIKLVQLAQKNRREEQEASLKALQTQTNTTLPHYNARAIIPSKNTPLRSLKSSYLSSKYFTKREHSFTRWLSKKEHQQRYDNGYYKINQVYPAYVEVDRMGRRRVLEIKYEPRFYWNTTSGRLYKAFKKQHVKRTLNGKQLLSLHIIKVDGVKVYTGIWISNEAIARESAKLQTYGIYPLQ